MKNYLQVILIMTLIFVSGCSQDDDNKLRSINLRINHHQDTGIGEGLYLTYLVQEGEDIGTDTWNKFYSHIEGFDYEPRYIYNLSVRVKHIDNPPADGSSLEYTLQEIISKEIVDDEATFNILLKINGQKFLTGNTISDFKILNEIEVDCDELCEELNERIQDQDYLIGTFKHLGNNKIQLIGLN